MLSTILDHACGSQEPDANGWLVFIVSVCCVEFRIVARKTAGAWEIASYTSEDA